MTVQLILFDLDGTLVDSLRDIAESMNRVLADNGLPVHPVEAYTRFIGDGIDVLVERALPEEHRSAETQARCARRMRSVYAERWVRHTRPYPGIARLLETLHGAGVATAVLTNKPHASATEMVNRLLPGHPFARVWGAGEGLPNKPDPGGALRLAAELGVHPSRCMYVGDMPVDVQTALAAGMIPTGATWGLRSLSELFDAGARLLLRSPSDLLGWVLPHADGADAVRYPVQARAAVGAVVIHGDRVLLVKRAKPPAQGVWAIPGGGIRLGESLQEAAEREILEETGVVVRAGEPVFAFDAVERDDSGAVRYHYVIVDLEAAYAEGTPRAGDDASAARWVSRAELASLDVNPRTRHLLAERFGFGT
ncbi:MAG: HAD hydrolase-like protein [Desulfobacteraceae bacterium]|nr:HAD hydrolase-like protein [Desulfobacteraceae bacterium]